MKASCSGVIPRPNAGRPPGEGTVTMARVLVAYATKYGSTKEVADAVAATRPAHSVTISSD
jgi:hypothetical protein